MTQQDIDPIVRSRYGILSIWLGWLLCAGAVITAVVLSDVVPKGLYPLVCLVLTVVLYRGVRYNRSSPQPTCFVLPFTLARAFFVSALVMIAINVMHRKHVIDMVVTRVDLINPEIPYIASLVLFPAITVMCLYTLVRGRRLPFCANCMRHNGPAAERGVLGEFYSREGFYQVRLMAWLSGVCTVAQWVYYFGWYINVAINSPDRFMFKVAPALLFGASILYVSMRYAGLWQYYRHTYAESGSQMGRCTKLRFLILCGNEMLVKIPDLTAPSYDFRIPRADTPATLTLSGKRRKTLHEAREHFCNLSGLKPDEFSIRFLNSNTVESNDASIFNYLVTLPSRKLPEGCRLKGEWLDLQTVTDMLNHGALEPLLSAELVRLVTITMAWKTYDERGYRRYEIRNYKPKFHLGDIAQCDVDFNDHKWLYVASNNQDKPFFRLRRLWSRWVSGSA